MSLYKSEWKKLWKRNATKLAVVLLIAYIGVVCYQSYQMNFQNQYFSLQNYNAYSHELQLGDERYTGFDALRKVDQCLQQKIEAQDLQYEEQVERYKDYLKDHLALRKTLQVDEQRMAERYGPHWEEMMRSFYEGTLTRGAYASLYEKDISYEMDEEQKNEIFDPLLKLDVIYYEDASQITLNTYDLLYAPAIPHKQMADKKDRLIEKDALVHYHELMTYNIQHIENQREDEGKDMFAYPPADTSDKVIAYLNQSYLDAPDQKGAMVAYEYFMNFLRVIQSTLFIPVILLGVILISLFSQEYTSKMDQLLRPVVEGNQKQSKAKLAVGGSLVIGAAGGLILIAVLVPQITIGYHSLTEMTGHNPISTIGEDLIKYTVSLFLAFLIFTAVSLLCSSICRSQFGGFLLYAAISSLLLFNNILLPIIQINAPFLDEIIPGSFFYPFHPLPTFIQVFDAVIPMIIPNLLVWLFISCICIWIAHSHYCKRNIKNC